MYLIFNTNYTIEDNSPMASLNIVEAIHSSIKT